jgi:hypothetical protein
MMNTQPLCQSSECRIIAQTSNRSVLTLNLPQYALKLIWVLHGARGPV